MFAEGVKQFTSEAQKPGHLLRARIDGEEGATDVLKLACDRTLLPAFHEGPWQHPLHPFTYYITINESID